MHLLTFICDAYLLNPHSPGDKVLCGKQQFGITMLGVVVGFKALSSAFPQSTGNDLDL